MYLPIANKIIITKNHYSNNKPNHRGKSLVEINVQHNLSEISRESLVIL